MRIGEADRFHRAKAQRLAPALRHHLDRQAALEIRRPLELFEFGFWRREDRVEKSLELLAIQGAIDVVGAIAARSRLVVARLHPGLRHVDRIAMHDWRDGVEERQLRFAGQLANRQCEG